ncbi:MAG TPA: endonuclease IV [Nanoarchaeota archaeon]|nr:endonuclease IV [Nanoarchaeota archaeon]
MLRLGPAGIPLSCKKCDTIKGVEKVAELGLNAMEVEFVRGVNLSKEKAKELGKVAQELDVALSVHAPYYINLASEDEQKVKASMQRIIDSLERAALMKAKVVVVHAGYYGKDKERAEKMIFNACKKISEYISKKKWKVFLGLETTGRQSQWGTLDEIIALCKKIKHCIPVIDFAHIYARNGGKIDYSEIFDKISELKLEEIHSHFSGIKFVKTLTGGDERQHLPIRESKGPDFKKLAKGILKRKINITIISESPILEEDALYMKEIFEKLGYKFTKTNKNDSR